MGYSNIWSALNAPGSQFPGLVPAVPNRQINAQNANYVPPTNAQAGDRPAVMLREGSLIFKRRQNSKITAFKIGYPLQILSGLFPIDKIGQLHFVVQAALEKAGINLGNQLIFISAYSAVATTIKASGDPLSKRVEWTSIGTVTVEFWIPYAMLLTTTWT